MHFFVFVSQLFRLAEYIISEYVQHLSNSQPIVAAGRPDLALGKLLEERCLLLLSCCGGSGRTEATLARHIADSISTPSTALDIRRRQATRQLLLHLYVRAPHVAVRLPSVFQEVLSFLPYLFSSAFRNNTLKFISARFPSPAGRVRLMKQAE